MFHLDTVLWWVLVLLVMVLVLMLLCMCWTRHIRIATRYRRERYGTISCREKVRGTTIFIQSYHVPKILGFVVFSDSV